MRRIAEAPPDAVVIYLAREPTHGEEVALGVRRLDLPVKIPIVFVDGDEKAVQRIRERMHGAIFATDETLDNELLKLVRQQPAVFGSRPV